MELQPYTHQELVRLARDGVRKLLVICPAFVADCLETLEEIGMRGKELFLKAGGNEFSLIPCLNSHPRWLYALEGMVNAFTQAAASERSRPVTAFRATPSSRQGSGEELEKLNR